MSLFSKIFGDESSKFIKNTTKTIAKINALEVDISKLVDADFPKKTQEFKDRLAKGESQILLCLKLLLWCEKQPRGI